MPFTFSHPAIVLPLTKARLNLSATGLIIGSMIPDFEYFIRMIDKTRYSHTLLGIFWFDLPLTLVVSFIYHQVVRNSLFDNLPSFLKDRFSVYKKFNWPRYFSKNWAIVLVSIIVGTASHILWDGVTHHTMFYVKQADLSTMMKIGTINLAGYKFLQLASSIVGGLAVIYSIFSLRRIHQPRTKIDYRYWVMVLFIAVFVFFLRFYKFGFHFYYFRYHRAVAVTFISTLMIGLILTPLLLGQKDRRVQMPLEKEYRN
jgi:uncharacterized protein DUF4184